METTHFILHFERKISKKTKKGEKKSKYKEKVHRYKKLQMKQNFK
jgi:hypothetical protein